MQARSFVLPGEPVAVELGEPDADRSCFPTTITHQTDRWTVDWSYSDRNKARDIYKTRTFLKAAALVQLADTAPAGYVMTAARITHPGTGQQESLVVAKPGALSEISDFDNANNGALAAAKSEADKAQKLATYGSKFKDAVTGMEFVIVKGDMQLYYMGKYEVTQGQWQQIMGNNPSSFSRCGADCPVENVSWNDAQQFIQRLNQRSGKQYRLPSEAEWQFACTSGGKNEEYCGGNNVDAVAWYGYDGNSGNTTHEVGQKQPNGLGIYDMSGNVWEWVQGADGSYRVARGGSWSYLAKYARASYRNTSYPGHRYYSLGFRLLFPLAHREVDASQ